VKPGQTVELHGYGGGPLFVGTLEKLDAEMAIVRGVHTDPFTGEASAKEFLVRVPAKFLQLRKEGN
jgi:hypothetical protein